MKKTVCELFIVLILTVISISAQGPGKPIDQVMPDFAPFNKFYAKAASLTGSQKIDLSKNYQIHIKTEFDKGNILDGKLSFETNPNNPALLELLPDFVVAVNESRVLKIVAFESKNEAVTGAEIEINSAESDFYFKLNFKTNSPSTAKNVANRFNWLFVIAQKALAGNPESEFYKNGAIEADKNQVFIATKISRQNLERFLKH